MAGAGSANRQLDRQAREPGVGRKSDAYSASFMVSVRRIPDAAHPVAGTANARVRGAVGANHALIPEKERFPALPVGRSDTLAATVLFVIEFRCVGPSMRQKISRTAQESRECRVKTGLAGNLASAG